MSIDRRTRRHCDVRALPRDEVFDRTLPDAIARHGELAGRGQRHKGIPPLGFSVEGRDVTLLDRDGGVTLEAGLSKGAVVARLDAGALSALVQDQKSAMGLAMTSKVEVVAGRFESWIGWEPVLRALLDGRPVHEPGAVKLRARSGDPLDATRRFSLEDDRDVMGHFLTEAGFLHVENVFTEAEMNTVGADLDAALARAEKDDGASWWAGDSRGVEQPVRVLFFPEQSDSLRALLGDDRLRWIGALTGDDHDTKNLGAEGLVKPLDIRTGLSDLPWHKDCGQGGHSYFCNGLTVGLSVTGADRRSGALGVVPGSHRANVQTAGLDESLDLAPLKLETRVGDVTVHCSDTLHRAYPPVDRPRKVVYTGIRLPQLPGDVAPKVPSRVQRAERARLTDVRDRINAAGGGVEA
jgi:hypothetical protein